jgi:hypothetical protein
MRTVTNTPMVSTLGPCKGRVSVWCRFRASWFCKKLCLILGLGDVEKSRAVSILHVDDRGAVPWATALSVGPLHWFLVLLSVPANICEMRERQCRTERV